MRFIVALLAVSPAVSGCGLGLPSQPLSGAWPPPVFGASPPASSASKTTTPACPELLTEDACKQGTRCVWVSEYKRADGSWATAHCSGS
jgi:hypothetical protein